MKKNIYVWILALSAAVLAALFLYRAGGIRQSRAITQETWRGYKHNFILEDGRVTRPASNDTVSEGQAYAMLRAVWMDDKETFDRCYAWTLANLSRLKEKGDHLLAWHWQSGGVIDLMPAADADIDYALALVFADAQWKGQAPKETPDYDVEARAVLNDILRFETFSTAGGRLYLAPWILDAGAAGAYPQNPSYYSPAHFRVFYDYTKDVRWNNLLDTSYFVLGSISKKLGGKIGAGLFPDWCSVNSADQFNVLQEKNPGFGWEAVRVPMRVALDYFWNNEPRAKEVLAAMGAFVEGQWKKRKAVFCEYQFDGQPIKQYENPLFYASYACAARVTGFPLWRQFLVKSRSFLHRSASGWYYADAQEYYVNSLAWFLDGMLSGQIKNEAAAR